MKAPKIDVKPQAKTEMGSGRAAPSPVKVKPQAKSEMGSGRAAPSLR